MGQAEVRRIVERLDSLPTLPTVVTAILQKVNDPRTSAEEINNIIKNDQSILSKVLKLVNSAFYGYSGRISTVKQAVMILGFNTIRSLALSASVFDAFKGESKGRFDRAAFWKHTIAVGVCARLIARDSRIMKEIEEAFVAGIIHDIGKVVLDQFAHDDLEKALEYADANNCQLYEAEKIVLGISHSQIGRWLAQKWKLPSHLVEVILYHHRPEAAKKDPYLVALIHLSDLICRSKKIGFSGDHQVPELNPVAWTNLKMEKSALEKSLQSLPEEINKSQMFLEMAKG